MSNLKRLARRENNTRLKRVAETAPAAQITVKEDSDMTGYAMKIEEALKISIQPKTIDGFIESFSGELNVTMSNEDELILKYETDEETNTSTSELSINGQSITLQPNFEPSQLTDIYKQFLGM